MTPTANLALFLLFLLGLIHAIPAFFTGVFGSADYLAYFNHHSAVADELDVCESRQTLLQVNIQNAELMVKVLQLDVQKANMTAQATVDVAKLAAGTKVFFGNLHAEEDRRIDLLRYQERRMLLEWMLQYSEKWERAGPFGGQGLIDDFLMKDKIEYISFAEQADESLMSSDSQCYGRRDFQGVPHGMEVAWAVLGQPYNRLLVLYLSHSKAQQRSKSKPATMSLVPSFTFPPLSLS